MSRKKTENENEKTFSDLTNKSWFKDGDVIKVGDSFPNIMKGDCETIEVKEVLSNDQYRTWKIAIDKGDKTYLLKSSRELR